MQIRNIEPLWLLVMVGLDGGRGGSVTGWVHGGAWGWREQRGYKPNAGGDEIVQRSPGNVSLLILFKQNMT